MKNVIGQPDTLSDPLLSPFSLNVYEDISSSSLHLHMYIVFTNPYQVSEDLLYTNILLQIHTSYLSSTHLHLLYYNTYATRLS